MLRMAEMSRSVTLAQIRLEPGSERAEDVSMLLLSWQKLHDYHSVFWYPAIDTLTAAAVGWALGLHEEKEKKEDRFARSCSE